MKKPITEVNFVYGTVDHFSFVTGLTQEQEGRATPHKRLNVILNIDIMEGFRFTEPDLFPLLEQSENYNYAKGSLFQCCDFLTWIYGTFDSKMLERRESPEGFNSPTEFVVETWRAKEEDLYEWQLKQKTTWRGVEWGEAAHTGDGGDRCCAGIANFVCSEKLVEEIEEGEKVSIPPRTAYPHYELRRVLQQAMSGPKHSENYMG